ncbi:nuclease-related domain-containing protein [Haloferula sp.]|uniref:nuclease-related domain-containing protein n=1 Tax=Haloferula sp. TaxID=2497595 RepID=UPI00329B3E5E
MLKGLLGGIPPVGWIAIGLLVVFKFVLPAFLPKIKGWQGERAVKAGLARLDPERYHVHRDLYLPRPDGGGTTQIDHVVVSPYGVFVIETKNYRGWIFGSEKQKQWTQTIYKRKQRFQNPLHQNRLHVRALEVFLGLDRRKFHSVVVFIGGSTFKTPMPANVLDRGFIRYISEFRDPLLDEPTVAMIRERLRQLEGMTDRRQIAKEHIRSLQARGSCH